MIYVIELELIRVVRKGSGTYKSIRKTSYGYGKNKLFKSSKEGLDTLKEKLSPYKSECSSINILIRKGRSGELHKYYESDKVFEGDFKENFIIRIT